MKTKIWSYRDTAHILSAAVGRLGPNTLDVHSHHMLL